MSTADTRRADSASCAVKSVVGTKAEEQGVCVWKVCLSFPEIFSDWRFHVPLSRGALLRVE